MENITNLPRCKECNRLLKKKDINEQTLCPKCLDKTLGTKLVGVLNLEPEVIQLKQINTEVREEPLQIEQDTEPSNDEQTTDTSDTQHERPPEDVKPKPINEQSAEVKVKPGQAIRDKFMELVSEGKITEEYIFELSTKEVTAQLFSVRYPFLKEFNPNVSIKEITYVNGHARYSSKPITIGGRQYLITNDLYSKTVPKFSEWADNLSKC
jgi:hypothetical protein